MLKLRFGTVEFSNFFIIIYKEFKVSGTKDGKRNV